LLVNEDSEIIDSFSDLENKKLVPLQSFKWETWHMSLYSERLKLSYEIIRDTFLKVK